MSLRKTAPMSEPHAMYEAGYWAWKVLKVNQPAKGPRGQYATWFVAARSPATFGSWEMGDTYAADILDNAVLVEASPEFRAYLGEES